MPKRASIYLKMQVLGAVECAPGDTIKARIRHVAGLNFTDEDRIQRSFTWRTIQTWYSTYKKYGMFYHEILERRDKGCHRKCTPEELDDAIQKVLPHFHKASPSKTQIYRKILEDGLIASERLSRTSFWRFIKRYDLLKSVEKSNKKRMAFSMRHANELWQGDSMCGPYVKYSDGKKQAWLIALIDDASRLITHGEFFFSNDTAELIKTMRSAFYKFGVPERFYFDNGSNYSAHEVSLVCQRLGSILCHTPVRDGAAKGKIERFFRTVRDQFLSQKLDLSSLEMLNHQFNQWVCYTYNTREHSTINMAPLERFNLDSIRIKYLPPTENKDELFYFEETRQVKKDNTFSFKNKRYEAPTELHGRKIHVRFDRVTPDHVVVYYGGERQGDAKLVDLIRNGEIRKRSFTDEQIKKQRSIFDDDKNCEREDGDDYCKLPD